MRTLILIFSLLALSACSSVRKVEYEAGADGPTELSKLGEEIEDAVGEQHDVLAPKEIEKSQKHHEKAKAELQKDGGTPEFWSDLGLSRAWLNRAKDVFTLRRPKAEAVLQAREAALIAGARRYDRSSRALKELDDGLK